MEPLTMREKLSAFVDDLGRARWLVGASVFRVVAGVAILVQYLLNYDQRRFLFGPDGVIPYAFFRDPGHAQRFSLYQVSASPWFFEAVFHTGLLLALLWTLGWKTRWLTPLVWLFWTSLHDRCSLVWDGGDNLTEIVLVFAVFADLSAHLSIEKRVLASESSARSLGETLRGLFHNAALVAIGIQVCVVYVVAGLTKVQGDTWRSGTALFHALSGGEFYWPGHVEFIYRNALVLTLLCYVTVGFQVSFPFLLLINRWTRTLAVCAGVVFHIGIMLYLGLFTFGAFMIAVDLSLIGDEEYRLIGRFAGAISGWAAGLLARLRGRRTYGGPDHAPASTSAAE